MKLVNKEIIKNFAYTINSNLISLIVSSILIIIIPKFIGIEDYGYWQLYTFYLSYITYLSLGLTDGAYLRYGGSNYKDLEKPLFISQFWFLVVFNIFADIGIILIYISFFSDVNKIYVILFACISGVLTVPKSLLTFTLQATYRIREYSVITVIERLLYLLIVLLFIFSGVKKFEYLLLADVIGKLISNIYAIYVCKDIVIGIPAQYRLSFNETKENISVGMKLLFANLASMLIIGIVRLAIEFRWGIEEFGKVSLTLSLSNMLMIFINSIGLVLFPVLRRSSQINLSKMYKILRTLMVTMLLGVLIVYFPLKLILGIWLPQYNESLDYMSLLFPIIIFESKMGLLINPYLKNLRKENMLLLINVSTVILSLLVTIFTVFLLENINLSILSITFLLACRSIVAELFISRLLIINLTNDTILELLMAIIFIYVSWNFDLLTSLIVYLFAYIVYIFLKKDEIKLVIEYISNMMRK